MFTNFLMGATQFLLIIGVVYFYRFVRNKIKSKLTSEDFAAEEYNEKCIPACPAHNHNEIKRTTTDIHPTQSNAT